MSKKRVPQATAQLYRQGDVLLIRTDQPQQKGSRSERDGRDRIVLAEGEVTGHAHAIADPEATFWEGVREAFLEVTAEVGVDLVHEEHAPIHLPQGWFKVVRQREFVVTDSGRFERWVAD